MKKYLLLLIFPLCLWSGCEKDASVSDVDGRYQSANGDHGGVRFGITTIIFFFILCLLK